MIWLDPMQLKAIGVTTAMLRHNRSKWKFRDSGERGSGNGKPIREVSLESLPQALQMQHLRMQNAECSMLNEELTILPAEVGPLGDVAVDPILDGERRLTEAMLRYEPDLRGALLAEATRLSSIVEKFDAINPKRITIAGGKREFSKAVRDLCETAKCRDQAVLRIEPKRGNAPSPQTLQRWSNGYKSLGLAAFLRKPAETPEIDNRKAEISAQAIQWMNANWRTKPSPWALHKALKKQAARHGWKIPAYGWVYRKYKDLPKIVAALAFDGEKKFASKFGVYVPRTVEDLTALQILCGDHSVRDVTVMLPDGQLTRPWLTSWQDMRTGLIWGWHVDLTPSSNTIGLAYVNGVQNFGAQPLSRPDDGYVSYLYTDQGKDYRCKTLTGQTLEFKKAARIEGGLGVLCTQRKVGFMEELGIKHIMARGYNAKEKPVERYHKDVSEFEKNTFKDEYCGKDTVSKPDAWVKAWHKHQRLLKKFKGNMDWLKSESPFMSLDDYRDNLAGWINEYNHDTHTRSVLGGSKVVPVDEYQRLYTTKYEISDDTLALLLMNASRKKIGKNGITMLNSQFLHPGMSEFKGEEIEVRYSDGDYSRIWAVLPNDQIVEAANLTRSSIVNPNKQTMEAVARQKSHERKLAREWNFVQQSNWRGESTEDRVAAQINPVDDMPPEQQKIAVNARPTVHALNRFDRPKLAGNGRSSVTADQVENANVIEGMFGSPEPTRPVIKEEWED